MSNNAQTFDVKPFVAAARRPTSLVVLEFMERFVKTTEEVRNTIARVNNASEHHHHDAQSQHRSLVSSTVTSSPDPGLFSSLLFDVASASAQPTAMAFNNNNNSIQPFAPPTWLSSDGTSITTTALPTTIFELPSSIYPNNNEPLSASNIANFLFDPNNSDIIDDARRNRYRMAGMQILDRPDILLTLLNYGGRGISSSVGGGLFPSQATTVADSTALADVMFSPDNFISSNFSLPIHGSSSTTTTTTWTSILTGTSEELIKIEPTFSAVGTTLITVFYALVVAISLFGNLSVIVVHVFGERWRRSDVAAFFVNLAISDIVQALFCVPFTAHNIINYWWYFGEIVCRLSAWMQATSVTASTYTLVCIAVDRYYLVKNPLHHRAITGKFRWLLVVIIWLIAVATSVPLFLSMELKKSYYRNPIRLSSGAITSEIIRRDLCIESWQEPWQEMLVTFLLVSVNFIFPLCIISVLYLAIIKQMRNKNLSSGFGAETSISGNRASSNRITVTAITVCVMFMVCWAPLHIYFLIASAREVVGGRFLHTPPPPSLSINTMASNDSLPIFFGDDVANSWLPSFPYSTSISSPTAEETDGSATLLSRIMDITRQNNALRSTREQEQRMQQEAFRLQQQQAAAAEASSKLAKTQTIDLLRIFYLVAHGMAMLNHATNFLDKRVGIGQLLSANVVDNTNLPTFSPRSMRTYSYVNREFRQDFLSFFRPNQRASQSHRSFGGSFSQLSMELQPNTAGSGWRRHSNNGYRDSTMTLPLTIGVNHNIPLRSSNSSNESKRILIPSTLRQEQRITGATFYLPSTSSLTAGMQHQNALSKVSVVSTTLQTPSTEGKTSGGKRLCRIKSSPQFQLQHQRDSERPLLLRASQVEATSHIALRRMGFVPPTPSASLNVYGSSIKRERFRSPKTSTVFQPMVLQKAASVTNNMSGGSNKSRSYSMKRKMYQLDKFDCEEP